MPRRFIDVPMATARDHRKNIACLESLARMMGVRFAGWAVHFGSCSTIDVPAARLRRFMAATSSSLRTRGNKTALFVRFIRS
jgi:hypothetical protein